MKPESKNTTRAKGRSTLWIPSKWVPKTLGEKAQQKQETADTSREMEATVAGLSPEMQLEIRALSASKDPRDAERKLLEYVVTDDHFVQIRKDSRRGDFKYEGRMRDGVYWIAMVPILVLLYFIFSWLSSGKALTH